MVSKFSRFITSEVFELTAQEQLRFFVHKDILASQSQPFQNATSGLWKEGTERKIILEDWDGDTVGRLVEFLYTGDYQYPDPELVSLEHASVVSDKGSSHRPPTSSDVSGESTYPERPLTPLNRCLRHGLSNGDKTVTRGLESFEPSQYDYKETLLSHAKVYALAHYKSVNVLRSLALKHLITTLSRISPVQPNSHIILNVIDLVNYVYSHTDSLASSEEPLRRLVSQFAALNFTALYTKEEMVEFISEGGDFITDLMTKVNRRLRVAENGLSLDPKVGRFVSGIRVLHTWTDDRPQDCIEEIHGGSSDVNSQHGGSYVWLVPEFTVIPEVACTGFQVSIQPTQDNTKDNLAQGDSGAWRYLVPLKDKKVKEKITEVFLFGGTNRRVANIAAIGPGNFDGMTIDLNTNRGDYCLYLVWKSIVLSK